MYTWPDIIEETWYYTDDENYENTRNLENMPVVPFSEVLVLTAYNLHNGHAILRGAYSEEKGWHWKLEWSNCDDTVPVEEFVANAYCYMFLYAPNQPTDGQTIEWYKHRSDDLPLMNSKDDLLILRCRNKDGSLRYVACTANIEELKWVAPDNQDFYLLWFDCEDFTMLRYNTPVDDKSTSA